MKYMGSKRTMLQNGLGTILKDEAIHSKRFIDLFSGSGVVSWFIAENCDIPIKAVDLQSFAATLTNSIIQRTKSIDSENCWVKWHKQAKTYITTNYDILLSHAQKYQVENPKKFHKKHVLNARDFCKKVKKAPVTKAYGGYYFSPLQSLWIDSLRQTIPKDKYEKDIALASLIQAVTQCAAAPGHTAQPFRPNKKGLKWIHDAWKQDICKKTKAILEDISKRYAKKEGNAFVGDANIVVKTLKDNDLVFVDPPYSGVHYSRFYHVLETIARGKSVEVTGEGRYPSISHRPQSKYSMRGQAKEAIKELIETLAKKKVKVILTFPRHKCSNGLYGYQIERFAKKYFNVTRAVVNGKFSTLGGNNIHRDARVKSAEYILIMKPKDIKKVIIDKVNESTWWHVPPINNHAYQERGKFLASTYTQAEFYGKPNMEPEMVNISNPIYGFTEEEILSQLYPSNWKQLFAKVQNEDEDNWYKKRITLDRKMYLKAKEMGYDSIVLLTPSAKKALEKGRKPNSIELNLLNI